MGALKGKTRVLVTNQLQFVSGANSVVYMQDGKIQERGTYEELMKSDQGFAQLMSSAEVTQHLRNMQPSSRTGQQTTTLLFFLPKFGRKKMVFESLIRDTICMQRKLHTSTAGL